MPIDHKTTCNRQLLERLLADDLTPAEEQSVADHLTGCRRCQRALEGFAADKSLWQDIQSGFPADAVGAAAQHAGDSTPEARDAWVGHFLDLLDPTDDPQNLGRLGCFEIRGIIGRGSTGIVLKAFEPRLNRFVAVKMLSPALGANGAARKRFEREGRAIAAVSHEHVVPIYAVDEHRGLPFLVMQYFPAGTLQQRIDRDGPLATEEILRAAMQIASGLAAAHAQGIIHRDIKPANVLLENDVNRVLVSDFGLARVVHDVALTQSSLLAGTPQYMSPEQARGEPLDRRSDLFGLGSVMYAMCTSHAPFRAETVFGVIKRVCESAPRRIRELNPSIPAWLEAFVDKLMAKEAASRFKSAEEAASILARELAHQQNPSAVPAPPRPWMPPAERGRRRRFAAAAGAALLMLVAGYYGGGLGRALMGGPEDRGPDDAQVAAAADSSEHPDPMADARPRSAPGSPGVVTSMINWVWGRAHPTPPGVPSDDVTAFADRAQMMAQVGVEFPADLPDPQVDPRRPPNIRPVDPKDPSGNWTDGQENVVIRSGFGLWVNYDDEQAGDYAPIDLLKMHDGTRIASEDEWWSKRRPELLADVQDSLWGRIPEESRLPRITWRMHAMKGGGQGDGAFMQSAITGVVDVSEYPEVRTAPRIDATLRMPADAKEARPILIVIGGDFPLESTWHYVAPRGWGVCAFNPHPLQPDNGAALTSHLIGLVNKGRWRKPNDWGALAAWSWGVSKLVDFFVSHPHAEVDAQRIGVTGHARNGKAAILAMAYDQRLAVCYPSCAGALGTKMIRRHWGQDLECATWEGEYHWAAGNLFQWVGPLEEGAFLPRKVELLPVDAHSLLALAAPRPVFLNAGTVNAWSDPYGTYLAGAGATPVYEMLGKPGLVMRDEKPEADVSYDEGTIAYRMHDGGHQAEPDWPAFVEFAGRYLDADR
jgi:hypothetical protein